MIDLKTELHRIRERSMPMHERVEEYDQWAEDVLTEIGRLHAIIRINALRWGATHEDVDRLIAGQMDTPE